MMRGVRWSCPAFRGSRRARVPDAREPRYSSATTAARSSLTCTARIGVALQVAPPAGAGSVQRGAARRAAVTDR